MNNFDKLAVNNLDEWIEFLKTGEISEAAQAPGLADARKCLDIDKLIVAEKPSVAMAYAKVFGATSRQDGYLEGNGYLVSWCVGHLVELAPPNVYDAKYVKWSIADLPILPQKWQYLVSASTKKQFGILQKLMHRPDVDSIVNSCDAG